MRPRCRGPPGCRGVPIRRSPARLRRADIAPSARSSRSSRRLPWRSSSTCHSDLRGADVPRGDGVHEAGTPAGPAPADRQAHARRRHYSRGDIIVFPPRLGPGASRSSSASSGVGGDHVEVRAASVYVNGAKLDDRTLTRWFDGGERQSIGRPDGHLFCSVDHRSLRRIRRLRFVTSTLDRAGLAAVLAAEYARISRRQLTRRSRGAVPSRRRRTGSSGRSRPFPPLKR